MVFLGVLRVFPSAEVNRDLDFKHLDWYKKSIAGNMQGKLTMTPPRYNDFSGQLVASILGNLLQPDSNDILGVMGIDITLKTVQSLINRTELSCNTGQYR